MRHSELQGVLLTTRVIVQALRDAWTKFHFDSCSQVQFQILSHQSSSLLCQHLAPPTSLTQLRSTVARLRSYRAPRRSAVRCARRPRRLAGVEERAHWGSQTWFQWTRTRMRINHAWPRQWDMLPQTENRQDPIGTRRGQIPIATFSMMAASITGTLMTLLAGCAGAVLQRRNMAVRVQIGLFLPHQVAKPSTVNAHISGWRPAPSCNPGVVILKPNVDRHLVPGLVNAPPPGRYPRRQETYSSENPLQGLGIHSGCFRERRNRSRCRTASRCFCTLATDSSAIQISGTL